jgi:tetratricopeptide (TPR) repeat protein
MKLFRLFILAFLLVGSIGSTAFAGGDIIDDAWKSIQSNTPYDGITKLRSYHPHEKERARYHYVFGRGLVEMKRYPEAVSHLTEAYITADSKPLKEASLYYRGLAYLRGGFSYEAASALKVFIEQYPDSALIRDAYANYARASLDINDFVNAMRYFKLAGDTPDGLFGKAEVFHRLGLYATASRIYSTAILKYQDYIRNYPNSLYYYVENLRMTGNAEDSKKLLYLLVETPLRDKAILSMGLIDMDNTRFDSTVAHFKRITGSTDRVVRRKALVSLSKVYEEQGKSAEAIRLLNTVRQEFPYTEENKEGLIMLSRIHRKSGDYKNALNAIREVLFGGRPATAAIEELKMLVQESMANSSGDFIEIWKRCGIWLMDNRYEDLLMEVAKGLERSGGDFLRIYSFLSGYGSEKNKILAMSRMAALYADFGDSKKASRYLHHLEGLGVSNDDMVRAQVQFDFASGKKDAACSGLGKISSPVGDDVMLLWRCGTGTEDASGYLPLYRAMIKGTMVSPRYAEIGDMLYRDKKMKEALTNYRIALTIDPDNAWALYRVGSLAPAGNELVELSKNETMLGKLARMELKERQIVKKLKEMTGGGV